MIFTQEQIQEIHSRLGRLGIKDTDLPPAHEVDGSETIAIVQDSVNKKIPLSLIFDSPAFESYYRLLIDTITEKQREIESLVEEVREMKIGLSNSFGDGETVGINQKVLTQSFNRIWSKLEDITGELCSGITMTVTPDYFISEEGCTVHVTAKTIETTGTFEKIQFFVNGTLVVEEENKDYFETDIEITETSVLKCVAKVMGVEYTREKLITHYNSFWLGAGTTYEDIMNVEHVVPITNGMRGAYNITCADSDNIFIVMSKGLRPGFIRADMNSFEIPFDETTVTINDEEYSVFTSNNTYKAGTYNIDING